MRHMLLCVNCSIEDGIVIIDKTNQDQQVIHGLSVVNLFQSNILIYNIAILNILEVKTKAFNKNIS